MREIETQQVALARLGPKRAEKNRRQRIIEFNLGGAARPSGKHAVAVAPEGGQFEAIIRQPHLHAAGSGQKAIFLASPGGGIARRQRREAVQLRDFAYRRADVTGRVGNPCLEECRGLAVGKEGDFQLADSGHPLAVRSEGRTELEGLYRPCRREPGDV